MMKKKVSLFIQQIKKCYTRTSKMKPNAHHANALIKKGLHDILVMNPMRDAMIEFLKATLSAQKKLHFSCIKNYKELKNHHFLTNPTILTYYKSLSFNKFPKMCKKNVKKQCKILNFPSIFTGKKTNV